MSRVYWTSKTNVAELRGSERAWLAHIAAGPAKAAWDIDSHTDFERVIELSSLIPEVPDGEFGSNYIHTYKKAAVAEYTSNKAYYSRKPTDPYIHRPTFDAQRQLVESLKLKLSGFSIWDTKLIVAGHLVDVFDLGLNTAIVAGSDPVRLAARIHAQCELHGFIEGTDRAWVADIIDEGLDSGIYRRELEYKDVDKRSIHSQGWEQVQELLREEDTSPVVLSFSVTDDFPNRFISDWIPDSNKKPETYDDKYWNDMTEVDRQGALEEQWYDLNFEKQWELAISGLRRKQPWAQISPESIDLLFGHGLSVYDIISLDRDQRVGKAFAADGPDGDHDGDQEAQDQ